MLEPFDADLASQQMFTKLATEIKKQTPCST